MKRSLLGLSVFIPVAIYLMLINSTKADENMFNKNPIFSVKVSSSLCQFEVRVNDIPVEKHQEIFPIAVSLPINHWLKSGKNTLSIIQDLKSNPATLPSSDCTAALIVKAAGEEESVITITNLQLSGGIDVSQAENNLAGDVRVEKTKFEKSEEAIIVSRDVFLPLKFPEWKWLTSDTITNDEKTKQALFKEYQKLHRLLENRELKAIDEIMAERFEEMASAFYETPEEMAASIKSTLLNNEMELFALDPDFEFEIMANGKLARITRWNGDAIIVYVYKDKSASEYFDMIYRKQDGKWVLAR